MPNQLIPENQFQTAVPSNDGLLTLRSTNTESQSNSDLLAVFNIPELTSTVPDLQYENLESTNELLNTDNVNEPITPIPEADHENLTSENELLIDYNINQPLETLHDLEYVNVSPDSELIPDSVPIEDVPVLFYTDGTCFKNMSSEALITTKEELFIYLCEVLIRFDASPLHYQKEDYEVLIRTLVGSLIYLYDKDSVTTTTTAPPFVGLALLTTDPLAFADARHYKYPGVYLAQIPGDYTYFNVSISTVELTDSIILLVPDITDEVFTGYHKEIFDLQLSNSGTGNTYSFRNEIMGGVVDDLNPVFTTSMPFVPGSLTVYLNGLKERNYTVDSDHQITFFNPPSRKGMIDIVEATYVIA